MQADHRQQWSQKQIQLPLAGDRLIVRSVLLADARKTNKHLEIEWKALLAYCKYSESMMKLIL